MTIQNKDKINLLVTILPEGVPVPSRWLQSRGFSRQLVNSYQKNGWLMKLGHGVYCRPGSPVTWEGLMVGIQRFAELPFHVGGITSLNNQGFAHYLPLGGEKLIHLWGIGVLPSWVTSVDLNEQKLVNHAKTLFSKEITSQGLVEHPTRARNWTIKLSSPERAIIEVLSEVQETEASFSFAAELFEGLTTLRPKLVNQLLQECSNVKAKRLFLFLSQYYSHDWAKHLETRKINIGKGKRQVTKNGKYCHDFLITVPKGFGVKDD